jgi:hypothetical protein
MKARSARLRHLVYHEDGCAGTKGSGERALKKRRTDEEREAEPSPEEREELRDKAKTAKSYEWFTVSRELFDEMRRDTRCVMHVKETPVGFVMHHPAVDMQDYWGRLHTSVLRTGEMQYFTRQGSAVLVCCPSWVRRGYVNVCIMGEFPETAAEAAAKQARIQDFLAHRGEFAYLDSDDVRKRTAGPGDGIAIMGKADVSPAKARSKRRRIADPVGKRVREIVDQKSSAPSSSVEADRVHGGPVSPQSAWLCYACSSYNTIQRDRCWKCRESFALGTPVEAAPRGPAEQPVASSSSSGIVDYGVRIPI